MNEINFTCAKPILDENGLQQYVKSIKNGEKTNRGKDRTIDTPCTKSEKGARLLKYEPTHSLMFKIIGGINLYMTYSVVNKTDGDVFSKKEGRALNENAMKFLLMNKERSFINIEDLSNCLPFIISETLEHYIQMVISLFNIKDKINLIFRSDKRFNKVCYLSLSEFKNLTF